MTRLRTGLHNHVHWSMIFGTQILQWIERIFGDTGGALPVWCRQHRGMVCDLPVRREKIFSGCTFLWYWYRIAFIPLLFSFQRLFIPDIDKGMSPSIRTPYSKTLLKCLRSADYEEIAFIFRNRRCMSLESFTGGFPEHICNGKGTEGCETEFLIIT